eukprot:3138486-Rhodomonas_salina.1
MSGSVLWDERYWDRVGAVERYGYRRRGQRQQRRRLAYGCYGLSGSGIRYGRGRRVPASGPASAEAAGASGSLSFGPSRECVI